MPSYGSFVGIGDLKRAHAAFLKKHEAALSASLDEAQHAAVSFVNRKPGFTRRTGRTQSKTKAKVIRRGGRTILLRVENSAKHAAVLESGSRAHTIRAKPGKTLRFWGFGKVIYRKSVRHPGTKPYRFLSRARNKAGIEFHESMKMRMSRIARSF